MKAKALRRSEGKASRIHTINVGYLWEGKLTSVNGAFHLSFYTLRKFLTMNEDCFCNIHRRKKMKVISGLEMRLV